MKIIAQDVFTALYDAFKKLDAIDVEKPELTAARAEIEAYHNSVANAQTEVEQTLKAGSELLDKYVDSRIKTMIQRMIRNGDIKGS